MKKMFHFTSSKKKKKKTLAFWENVYGIIGVIGFIVFLKLIFVLFSQLGSFTEMWVK